MSEPASPEEFADQLYNIDLHEHCVDVVDWQKRAAEMIRKRDWQAYLRGSEHGAREERERCARIAEHFDQLPPATIASAIRNENIGKSEERTSAHEED